VHLSDTRPAVQHPEWCSPAHCDAAAGHADVRHSSAPEVWIAAEDEVELQAAVHRDDYEEGLQVHGVTLRLHVDGTPLHADVLLGAGDIQRLEAVFARYRQISSDQE
jgi:hypothetical protein